MSDEREEVVDARVTRQNGAEVTELILESKSGVRQTGIVELGYRDKFLRYYPGIGSPPETHPTDGHTAERHKVLNSPPEARDGSDQSRGDATATGGEDRPGGGGDGALPRNAPESSGG